MAFILNEIYKDLEVVRKRKGRYHYPWEPFMRKYKCDYVCELGVRNGGNFTEMIRHSPKLAVAIDSWIDDGIASRNDKLYSQDILNQQYEGFKKTMKAKSFVKIYREYTFDAVKRFRDNFFDFVYIDADHSYEGCYRDLNDWYPKVKKGKFFLGDDYRSLQGLAGGISFGVKEAINDFTKKNKLNILELPEYGWCIIKM